MLLIKSICIRLFGAVIIPVHYVILYICKKFEGHPEEIADAGHKNHDFDQFHDEWNKQELA